jgi:alpha-glucosidase (family GH31 glycosyl hydrolase)
MGDKQTTFLTHRPFGRHHPYEQEPEERFPREPIAGEPVKLGVKTSAGSAIESVWAVWRIAGSTVDHRVAGRLVEKADEFNLWHVDLEPFESGSRISYCLFAKGATVQEQTAWFDFAVSSWLDFKQIESGKVADENAQLILVSNEKSARVKLSFSKQASGTLTLDIQQLQNDRVQKDAIVNGKTQMTFGDVVIDAANAPFSLSMAKKDGSFSFQSAGSFRALVDADGQITRYAFAFSSPEKEAFYGFGERYNSLDQRGSTLVNRVIDQYKRQGRRTYYPVPFFLSSSGYGVWVKTDREVIFDMAESDHKAWKIDSEAGSMNSDLSIDLMPQGTPNAIIGEFTRLTGRTNMPPSWVFGLWMSSNDWNSQAEVLKQYELTQKHKIASTVFVIEAWSDEANFYIWNDAQYKLKAGGDGFKYSDFTFPKEGRWPDPKGMVDTLHAGGTRLILWQNPTLKKCMPEEKLDERQNLIDEQYWLENNLGVMEADGKTPYRVRSPWFREGLVADFTNPKTIDWWFKQREYLVTRWA